MNTSISYVNGGHNAGLLFADDFGATVRLQDVLLTDYEHAAVGSPTSERMLEFGQRLCVTERQRRCSFGEPQSKRSVGELTLSGEIGEFSGFFGATEQVF